MFKGKRGDQPDDQTIVITESKAFEIDSRPIPNGQRPSQSPAQAFAQRGQQTNPSPSSGPALKARREDGASVSIGKGTTIVGEIRDCAQLDVIGTFEGSVAATLIIVHPGGRMTGSVHAATAEVHGTMEGEIKVDQLLDVRSTAVVDGDLAYGSLAVEAGGQVTGTIMSPQRMRERETPSDYRLGSSGNGAHSNGAYDESRLATS
jgi:cytoskeletal protein CcmA (bactofilin family)